jgi:hypothetical protein
METEKFYMAAGLTNKISKDEYFLVIDYDQGDLSLVEGDIRELQLEFNLSDCSVFKTKMGFHAYFFKDNGLSADSIGKILSSSKQVDPKFVQSWDHFSSRGEGVTLRTSGKYERRDIHFSRNISGVRPASPIEESVAISLEKGVIFSLEEPTIQFGGIMLEISNTTSEEPTMAIESISEKIDAVVVEEIFHKPAEVEIENHKKWEERTTTTLPTVNTIFQKNTQISALRAEWYENNPLRNSIIRLISAASEGREIGLMVPRDLIKKTNEEQFFPVRSFFLSNDPIKDKMLKPWDFVYEKKRMGDLPFNIFHTHATLDMDLIPKVPLMWKDHDDLSKDLLENMNRYITSFDIVFDLDSKEVDQDISYQETKKLRDLFLQMGIPFSLNFSGSKGFHIRIPAEIVGIETPELIEFLKAKKEGARIFFSRLLEFTRSNGIEVDPGAYSWDLKSLIRIPWTIHQATGSVVKPMTDSEFDSLSGKTLAQIQEMYQADILLKGSKALGVSRLNFQKREFSIRVNIDGTDEWMTWEEMRDSGRFNDITEGKKEWEWYRSSYINPTAMELRRIAKEDSKRMDEILASGEFDGFQVEANEFIDLVSWRNFDYRRKGSRKALRDFIQWILPEAFGSADEITPF